MDEKLNENPAETVATTEDVDLREDAKGTAADSTESNVTLARELSINELEKLDDPDEIEQLWKLIQRHQTYTRSARAAKILQDWKSMVPKFVKVMPKDYKRVLEELKRVEQSGLTGDEAIMAAFEANTRDVARIGGG